MSFYGKKNIFREVPSSPFVSPFSQSVPCFSHIRDFESSCCSSLSVTNIMVLLLHVVTNKLNGNIIRSSNVAS